MKKEGVAGLLFVITGIYGLTFSSQLSMGKWNEPGAGVFPLSLSILLLISGFLQFIQRKGKGEKEAGIDWRGMTKRLATPLQIVAVTGAFILSLDPLGYLTAATLYMFVLFLWVSRYRLGFAAGLAVVFGAGSWVFFAKILVVQLPRGLIIP